MPDPGHMRISHQEREAVASQLRDALDAGRLDLGEFDQRTRDLYDAQTYDEVARLLEDLPQTNLPVPPQPAPATPRAEPEEKSNLMGHIALGMGVMSFASFAPFTILAIVFGCIGLDKYRKGESDSRSFALAGLILGAVSIPVWIMFFVLGAMFWF
ncbi:DUF1707 and DUF4190 domain-containing protein [Glycomyces sp. NPDC046736]|uniref:DUF1707 and DUF4190 domain-containing protein n=1 Tax=Glycomyces sp. NPDC046736 TaxID=3155615 RepID=UPI0034035DD4